MRATSLLCLLGVGLGLGSVLLYKVYTRIFGAQPSPYDRLTPDDRNVTKRRKRKSVCGDDEEGNYENSRVSKKIHTHRGLYNQECRGLHP